MTVLKQRIALATTLCVIVPGARSTLLEAITADIRPAGIVGQALDPERTTRGRAIAARGVEAQGGRVAWERLSELSLTMTDDWDITPFRLYMPLSEDHVELQGTVQLHHHLRDSSWTITTGRDAGVAFGLHDGQAWYGEPSKPGGVGVQFYAPTMEFLPTLAFHVGEADVVSWLDTVDRDGQRFDRVLVTWGDPDSPTAHTDQYIVYYAQDTGLLTLVECTVRDFGPFVTGSVAYDAWTEVGGVRLPSHYTMGLVDLDGPQVHAVALRQMVAR